MEKWANYLISEVEYDSETRLITRMKQHVDDGGSLENFEIVDRATVAHNLSKGKTYMTIYNGGPDKWKKGNPVRTHRVDGNYSIRIDNNKVNHDFLGDIPELTTE